MILPSKNQQSLASNEGEAKRYYQTTDGQYSRGTTRRAKWTSQGAGEVTRTPEDPLPQDFAKPGEGESELV